MRTHESIHPIDHTADAGFEVHAGTLDRIFTLSARGLFDLIIPGFTRETGSTEVVDVQAGSMEDLLHAWLSELLWLHASRRIMVTDATVTFIGNAVLTASVTTTAMTKDDIARATEIKAVTWHGFSLVHSGGAWRATVIFDT